MPGFTDADDERVALEIAEEFPSYMPIRAIFEGDNSPPANSGLTAEETEIEGLEEELRGLKALLMQFQAEEFEALSARPLPADFVPIANAALERFAEGYAEYGAHAADALGLAGQWAELHRKTSKLKRSMWNGENGHLTRESEEEILQDLIGHALLALEMLSRGFEGGK